MTRYEQRTQPWRAYQTVDEDITERGTHLKVDEAGQFYLITLRDAIDGKAVSDEFYYSAATVFSTAGESYDPARVTRYVVQKQITSREAAKLFLENSVPECIRGLLTVRAVDEHQF